MGLRIATEPANAILDLLTSRLDAGAGPATLKFYAGLQPPTADTAVTDQTLLGRLTFSVPAAEPASGRATEFYPIEEDTAADASGLATWARAADSDGNAVFDVDVGDKDHNPTAVIQMNSAEMVEGGPIRLASFSMVV